MSAPVITTHFARRVGLAVVASGLAALASVAGMATVADAATRVTPSTAASSVTVSGVLYGDPTWADRFWYAQSQSDCTLVSSADLVGQVTGEEPAESQVIARATSLGLYDPKVYQSSDQAYGGGPITENPRLITKLLHSYEVQAGFASGQTMAELEQDLSSGHAVIATVDAEFIWNVTDPRANPSNDQDSYTQDHALVVTGVNTATGLVYLNDSGNPDVGRGEQVPITVFEKAWSAPFGATQGQTFTNALVVTSEKTQAPVPATSHHGPSGASSAASQSAATAAAGLNPLPLAAGGAAILAIWAVVSLAIRRQRRARAAFSAAGRATTRMTQPPALAWLPQVAAQPWDPTQAWPAAPTQPAAPPFASPSWQQPGVR